MRFIVAFRVIANCVLSGTTPLGVSGLSVLLTRSSSVRKKRKTSAAPSSQNSRVRQSPRLHPSTSKGRKSSAVIVPLALDSQLSTINENEVTPSSPELLDDSQGSVVPGTELPLLPPVPSVARARSHDSSSYEDDDDKSSSSSDYTPHADNTPTKTIEEEDESDLGVQLGQPTEPTFATDFCFGQFDGEYDMSAEDFSFHERVMHHLGGRRIDNNNRLSVEFACILEAGTIVTDKHTMESREIDLHFEEEYVRIIDGFRPEDFQERSLQAVMRSKLYRANKTLQGHRLKKKFREIRAEIRSEWVPMLPMNISQLASGTQLRDSYKKVIVKIYRDCNPGSTAEQHDDDVYKDIPSDWWLYPDSKARLLLSCMVHRKNKEIAPLCTGHQRGKNRETQRKEKEKRIQKERDDDRDERHRRYMDDPRMQRQQQLQEYVARMAIIDKDIDAIGKKAAYVNHMIEIYMKTRDSLVAKHGEEWFDGKIADLVAMLPDVNKSLLQQHDIGTIATNSINDNSEDDSTSIDRTPV